MFFLLIHSFPAAVGRGGRTQRYIIILAHFPPLEKRKGRKRRAKKQIKIAIYKDALFVYNSKVCKTLSLSFFRSCATKNLVVRSFASLRMTGAGSFEKRTGCAGKIESGHDYAGI